ncbi:MBL fold metallo-hydrolase [Sphingomonas sp. XMGL2]|uniref:MBL fold metallo-hydrolase n=1 Tax=Sphingomonas quercus TaxID=2842451 RepID=A0ABS6BME8_9SPHN|nr:MBL fold metallo-hydrolase [Sphingomonas quercus]MBU3078956.1 MBL fold metallo-hydrolase [Sphingomonas quercus]
MARAPRSGGRATKRDLLPERPHISSVTEQAPDHVQPLSPLVRRVLAANPSPFTFTGTQTYVVGKGEVAVIDPGPDLSAHIDAILAATAGERVTAILCTHTHRDHSPGAAPLKAATGAEVIGCAPLSLDDDGPRADAAFDTGYAPDRVLADGERVSGPGWTLEAVATPGHTSNHLCFALAEERALFSGDHVMGWSTTVVSPPDGDMAAYMASLDRLMARADHLYYPAHGEPIAEPQRWVRGLIGHRRQREGQILRLLGEDVGLIPEMVARMYSGIDPRLHPAAGRSVLAHLIDLEARARVARDNDRWRLAA